MRWNYTSRNVIVPLHTLHDDEVDLSYHTFLELNESLVMRYLSLSEGISLSQAKQETEAAKVRFSEKIYELMQYIVEKDKPHILLNRNPTLR